VDDAMRRRVERQQTWTARRLSSRDTAAVEAAERDWWRATTPAERVLMVDAISADAFAIIGIDASERRLQRSVTRIHRGRG
jgi:hypothetical protein